LSDVKFVIPKYESNKNANQVQVRITNRSSLAAVFSNLIDLAHVSKSNSSEKKSYDNENSLCTCTSGGRSSSGDVAAAAAAGPGPGFLLLSLEPIPLFPIIF
jgi:hypothetical protein